jgi:lipid-A-disaccharide synthase
LPIFLRAFDLLNRKHPELCGLIAASNNIPVAFYQQFDSANPRVVLLRGWTREIMAHSRAAWVKSGTATLETALFGTPLLIAYKANPITYRIVKTIVKVPYIGMVNILAHEQVVTELIQHHVTPERLAWEMEPLIYNDNIRQAMIVRLHKIREHLGEPGSGGRVASRILELIYAG